MYIHIGGEKLVLAKEIIGIFDLDQIISHNDKATRTFLRKLEAQSSLISISDDLPRSLVLLSDCAYLSPINAHTLQERIKQTLIADF